MKTLNRYILLIAVISVLIPNRKMNAQTVETLKTVTIFELQIDCTGNTPLQANTNLNTINENDYPYLRNLECLKNDNFLKNRGFTLKFKNMNSGKNTHFVLTGTGHKVDVQATYDKDGKLLESLLSIRDTQIPHAIRQYIFSGKFDGWTMTGNEKIVKDFDPFQTEYKIIMINGNGEKVLNFKEYGNTITYLEY